MPQHRGFPSFKPASWCITHSASRKWMLSLCPLHLFSSLSLLLFFKLTVLFFSPQLKKKTHSPFTQTHYPCDSHDKAHFGPCDHKSWLKAAHPSASIFMYACHASFLLLGTLLSPNVHLQIQGSMDKHRSHCFAISLFFCQVKDWSESEWWISTNQNKWNKVIQFFYWAPIIDRTCSFAIM